MITKHNFILHSSCFMRSIGLPLKHGEYGLAFVCAFRKESKMLNKMLL